MSFIQRDAALSTGKVTYHVAGDGRPLLYLHSAGGVRMTSTLASLAQVNQVFALVVPGFDGTESHPGVDTMRAVAGLAAEFVREVIKEKPVDVIGHSFGGRTAAWLAVDHPDVVAQLVLECPSGFRPPSSPKPSDDPAVVRRHMFAHPEKLPANQKPPEQAAANQKAAARYNRSVDYEEALVARLADIQSLTLILAGTEDGRVPPEASYLLRNRIPDSQLIFVYDAAHNVEVDQPERFMSVVRSFLDRGKAFIVNWGDHKVAGVDVDRKAAEPGREALTVDPKSDHLHF